LALRRFLQEACDDAERLAAKCPYSGHCGHEVYSAHRGHSR
jgi:hypothetical protein